MTTMAGLTSHQLQLLAAIEAGTLDAVHDRALVELYDLGLIDRRLRLTIAGRAVMPPLLHATLGDPAARQLVCEVEADDRRA